MGVGWRARDRNIVAKRGNAESEGSTRIVCPMLYLPSSEQHMMGYPHFILPPPPWASERG